MKKHFTYKFLLLSLCSLLFLTSCSNFGNLKLQADLPSVLEEVSGIQYDAKEDAFWMLNDSGNKPSVYLVSKQGKIVRELKIDAQNNDWEDITMDAEGNLYVGDFGNNENKRKDLHILKVKKEDLDNKGKIKVEKIYFSFPEQKKFPPKKKKKYYDVEAFFEWKGSFYIFTKSRVKNEIGRTFLYRVNNIQNYKSSETYGVFEAELIADFTTCPDQYCWITAADISKDGKKVVLINHKSAWVFTGFTGDNFFSGSVKEYPFEYESQKESITFQNKTSLFIADEENGMEGRNLYQLEIKE
ncbi:SdiA-regulated domain-containing protein [Pseudotenacibaculum sp. MALMAid0570]|uniref:SdiA-regulated domain-containing protein n=1 Tax=Pseudotenacibaculum sp. MALMAid0570 TaxID=3143938 RepID=UPI0032DE59F5